MSADEIDVVIIGGGAAGLMCAATAGYRGRRVCLLEHANKVGKKILMSGGGRCNFTNLDVQPGNYISNNKHFCKSALSRYTSENFIELVERYGVAYHEKEKGQLFCNNKSKDIVNILLEECHHAGVSINTQCKVVGCEKDETGGTDGRFLVETEQGAHRCQSLVVATGGLSIPTMGATGFGYELAKQFGLLCTETAPSLVPYTLHGSWLDIAKSLAGVAMPVTVSCGRYSFFDSLLFTHRGLSGPSILQISNYWNYGEEVTIDFLPSQNIKALLHQWKREKSRAELKNALSKFLPKRFAEKWVSLAASLGVSNKPVNQYSDKEIEALVEHIHHFTLVPSGTEGYRTAEVTRGGVDTDGICSKTMMAKRVDGLYFIGEVLDVTGWLGGFNFQWAWASGYCAGLYV